MGIWRSKRMDASQLGKLRELACQGRCAEALSYYEALAAARPGFEGESEEGDSAMHLAAALGLPELAKGLLRLGATRSSCDGEGMLPYHRAIEADCPEAMEILDPGREEPDALDGRTPLAIAAKAGSMKALGKLLGEGREGGPKKLMHPEALRQAILAGKEDAAMALAPLSDLRILFPAGCPSGALEAAYARGLRRLCKALVDLGAPMIPPGGEYAHSALRRAVERKDKEFVGWALDKHGPELVFDPRRSYWYGLPDCAFNDVARSGDAQWAQWLYGRMPAELAGDFAGQARQCCELFMEMAPEKGKPSRQDFKELMEWFGARQAGLRGSKRPGPQQ